jgi:glycerate dehydrogenase
MNIVILDHIFLKDLDCAHLKQLGSCQFYDRTQPDQVLERCREADAILVNKVQITRDLIEQLPRLKYIGIVATGTNNVDLQAAKERKIIVTRVPAYSTPSVAQHTFALLFELTNWVSFHNQLVQRGIWAQKEDFAFWDKPLLELEGKTLGIVGFGAIGQAVAKIGEALGMKVIVFSRTQGKGKAAYVDLETLFKTSDVISLHCPLTEETKHLISEKTLGWMKSSAILLNTGRGGLVDEKALAKALREKRIAAAAVDVLEKEPPSHCPLIGLENCLITPHLAWASQAARSRLLHQVVANLQAYQAGHPIHTV